MRVAGRHLRGLRPARGRDVAAADVDGDEHARAERLDHGVEEVDVAERRGADDHALGAGAQRLADRRQRAQPAAVLDGHAGLARDPPQVLDRARLARAGAVEVDDVEEARARVDPRLRGRRAGRRGRRSCPRSGPRRGARPCRRGCRWRDRGSRAAKFAQQREPVARGLLGMELDAGDVVALDDRGEALAVLATADDVVLVRGPADERVHVVEGRALAEAARQRASRCGTSPRSSRCAGAWAPPAASPRRAAGRAPRRPRARRRPRTAAACRGRCPARGVPAAARSRITSSRPGRAEPPHRLREGADARHHDARRRRGSRRGRRCAGPRAPTCSSAFSTERRLPIP